MATRNGLWICALAAAACESGSFEALSTRDAGDAERDSGSLVETRDAGFRDGGASAPPDGGHADAGTPERDVGVPCGHRVAEALVAEISSPLAENYVELTATRSEFALAYNDHVIAQIGFAPVSALHRFPLRGPETHGAEPAGLLTFIGSPMHRIVETSTTWPVAGTYIVLASAPILDEHYLEVGAYDPVSTATTTYLFSGGPPALDEPMGPRIGRANVHADRLFYPVRERTRTILVSRRIDIATSTTVVIGENAELPSVVTGPEGPWIAFVERRGTSDAVVIQRLDPVTGAPDGFEVREIMCVNIASYDVALYGGRVAITADCAQETVVRFALEDGRPLGSFTLGETNVRTRVAAGYDLGVGEIAVLHWEVEATAPTIRFFEIGFTTDGGGAIIQSAPAVSLPIDAGETPTTLALAAGDEPPPRSRTRWAAAYASSVGTNSRIRLLRFDGCELP